MPTPTLNFDAFEAFISSAAQSTRANVNLTPLVASGKVKFSDGLASIKKSLNFSLMEEDQDFYKSLTLDKKAKLEESLVAAVNWLVTFSKQLMDKVNDHATLIADTQKVVEEKVDKVEMQLLRTKVNELEEECDEARQRNMKGNLLINSPNRDHGSLMERKQVQNKQTGAWEKESDVEMCLRIIHQKTGVAIPPSDISACHAINNRGLDSTYIIRVTNMKPGSAWDSLASCLLTGRCKGTPYLMAKEVNAYINFQVTPRRGHLLKAARLERKNNRQLKYGVDQNGRVTVQVSPHCNFEVVKSVEALQELVRNPPVRGAFSQYR